VSDDGPIRIPEEKITRRAGWRSMRPRGARGPNGRPLCIFCAKEVPPGRRSMCSGSFQLPSIAKLDPKPIDPRTWKGWGCAQEVYVRTRPDFARRAVYCRDLGVCLRCGLDTQALKRLESRELDALMVHDREIGRIDREARARHAEKFALFSGSAGEFWNMDHASPVAEGGGQCGLENLRTLCVPCHRIESAALAARRAAARKAAK
jgi:5-methylcytosine-specific restriction protein A